MAVTWIKKSGARPTFEFIDKDIRNQLTLAGDVLDQAKRLQHLIAETTDPEKKRQLESLLDDLVGVARRLAENAEETSNTATVIINGTVAAR